MNEPKILASCSTSAEATGGRGEELQSVLKLSPCLLNFQPSLLPPPLPELAWAISPHANPTVGGGRGSARDIRCNTQRMKWRSNGGLSYLCASASPPKSERCWQ